MGASIVVWRLLWSLVVCLLTVPDVLAHMCMREPPQRLQKGDELNVDCYQTKSPPCGQDFPDTLSVNPQDFPAGTNYPVQLFMPVRHQDPDNTGMFEINIAMEGSQNFTRLGTWEDGPEETRFLKVKMPEKPGKYILQAIYRPYNHGQYYSCADIVVHSAIAAPSQGITVSGDGEDNSSARTQPHLMFPLGLSLAVCCLHWVLMN